MNRWRKAFLFFCIPVLLSSSVALAQLAGGGPDRSNRAEATAPEPWARKEIDKLRARGILPGGSPASAPGGSVSPALEPAGAVTRAEVAMMLASALGAGADARALSGAPTRFSDVDGGHWAAGYVEAAAELGLFKGYGDRTFRPEGEVSRVELAAIIVRALGWEERASNLATEVLPFTDAAEIPPWGRGYVILAARQGIVREFEDGSFQPSRATLRFEAAALVARLLDGRGALFDLAGNLREVDLKGQKLLIGNTAAPVEPDAVIFQDGLPAVLGDLRPGDPARVILDDRGKARYVETRGSYALGRVTEVAISRIPAGGAAAGATEGRLTFSPTDGSGARTVSIFRTTRVFFNGKAAGLEQIRAGDRVFLSFNGWSGAVQAVDATRVDLSGRVLESGGQGSSPPPAQGSGPPPAAPFSLTVALEGGAERTLTVSPNAVVFLNGNRISPAEVAPGDRVSLALGRGDTVTFVEALR